MLTPLRARSCGTLVVGDAARACESFALRMPQMSSPIRKKALGGRSIKATGSNQPPFSTSGRIV